MHPNATIGKETHSLAAVMDAFISLLMRKYNADALYRQPTDPPVKKVYKGRPTVLNGVPAMAVWLELAEYEDAPQRAGADIKTWWHVTCYGRERGVEPQQDEAIRMAEAVRHIVIDNHAIPTKEGTGTVYQMGYLDMTISFDEFIGRNNDGEDIGCEIADLKFLAVFGETGY